MRAVGHGERPFFLFFFLLSFLLREALGMPVGAGAAAAVDVSVSRGARVGAAGKGSVHLEWLNLRSVGLLQD